MKISPFHARNYHRTYLLVSEICVAHAHGGQEHGVQIQIHITFSSKTCSSHTFMPNFLPPRATIRKIRKLLRARKLPGPRKGPVQVSKGLVQLGKGLVQLRRRRPRKRTKKPPMTMQAAGAASKTQRCSIPFEFCTGSSSVGPPLLAWLVGNYRVHQ